MMADYHDRMDALDEARGINLHASLDHAECAVCEEVGHVDGMTPDGTDMLCAPCAEQLRIDREADEVIDREAGA